MLTAIVIVGLLGAFFIGRWSGLADGYKVGFVRGILHCEARLQGLSASTIELVKSELGATKGGQSGQ